MRARGRRPAREPSALRAALGASSRSPARPRHRPRAPQPGPPDPPPPTGTATRSHHHPRAPQPSPTGTPSLTPRPSLPSFLNPHAISHAIPPRLFQTFNLDRWNCNVFRLCWNFSQSNCMRLFGGRLRTPPRAPQPGPHPRLSHTSAKKLALLASISVHTRKSSPSTATTAQNQPIFTRRANFFAVWPEIDSCWASFFALMGATAASQHPPTTSPETDDTNAGGSLPRNETTDTFARTKEPISGRFPPAKVSRVSCTPHRAPAKASLVSSDVESRLLIHSKALRRSCLLPPSHSW